ncbi:ImmA/IrrE family metallo-endopeptidase [Halomonas piscis]|uniref:ImmA/IrrE family metallo-endopeptidase n=1 Tax=Halomonas piscis TaxID=3031727 RepID=UPI00289A6CB1|nr:ImmA/IrrE family metallo-endopeptidase [Halomonas piscis]
MATHNVLERARKARELAWDGNFPVDPIAISKGITIVKGKGEDEQRLTITMVGEPLDEFSGYAELLDDPEPGFRCAFNYDEAPVRQRFTQAHELGHVLLNHVSKEHTRLRDTTFNDRGDWREIDANAFAAELIMPEEYVRHQASKIPNIGKLAKYFGVSATAIRYRLKNLGLL